MLFIVPFEHRTYSSMHMMHIKAELLRYKELQLPKMCRGTEIVRMNSNNPRSPLETNYR